jgi:hypothetical protein
MSARRAEAAALFLRDFVFLLLLILGGVWALLTWFEPCAAGSLCSIVPLVRFHRPQPRPSSMPRWWRRLALRWRLMRLGSRKATAESDCEWLRRDLTLIRNLLDMTVAEGDEIDEEIAWARSDLAKLQ